VDSSAARDARRSSDVDARRLIAAAGETARGGVEAPMKLLDTIRFRLATLFEPTKLSAEMEAEQRSHIEHRADDLERSGVSRREAVRRAKLEFGGAAKFAEESKEAAGGTFVESIFQDVRYATRLLRKSPGFTLVAVLTLALGIGANAVVFGALNALILRPINLPNAQSLLAIVRSDDPSITQSYVSYPDYIDLRDRNTSFEALAAYSIGEVGLDAGDGPARVSVSGVSGNYFDVLDVQPYLGRFLHASDERGANSAPYVVLSYGFWHSHFHDDPGIVGRTVQVNKQPFTVIGVAARGFHGSASFFSPDIFVPLLNEGQIDDTGDLDVRGNRWVFQVLGHLKPGVTRAQALADLRSIGAYLQKTYPNDDAKLALSLARPSLLGSVIEHGVAAFVMALMVLAGLILLAACTNLGSLFAARTADRSRELALRLALGSSRARIMRQLFTEVILLSLAGGAIGLCLSVTLLNSLSVWRPFPQFPLNVPVAPDWRVYAAALVLAVASGFLFGAIPVKQVLQADPYEVVKSGAASGTPGKFGLRDVLLAVQIAICAVLVTASLVAVRGLVRSLHSNFGFEPRGALLVQTDLSMDGYRPEAQPAMQKRLIEEVRSIPGVKSVGIVSLPPLHLYWATTSVFKDSTASLRSADSAADAIEYDVSPEYFQAAQTPLISGRALTWQDDKNAPRVAVVNREFARRLFGSEGDAIGRYFKIQNGTKIQVAGIVDDGKYTVNLAEDPQAAMFLPVLQAPTSETWMVVRSDGDPRGLTGAIRSKVHELDPGLPTFMQTWTDAMNGALFPPLMASLSLGVLGAMGALLSVTGIFGLATYAVSKRKRELGIRMALGAQKSEVLAAALGRALKLLVFGSAAGLILGLLASRVLAMVVYGATPRDPLVLAGVVLAMLLVGLIATWIPAQRALAVGPAMLMRED
jgi:predicted permease